ncbi:MAG: hypothetical protein WA996_22660 [Candidatus Promineifilaceae bacterium]
MRKRISALFVMILFGLLLASVVLAVAGELSLSWWSVDGGGGQSIGGEYAVQGAIGQPEAGTVVGDDYLLTGGFWAGPSATGFPDWSYYIPLVFTSDEGKKGEEMRKE